METLSFITFFLMIVLVPTFFISLINPSLLKLDSRIKSLKIHLVLASFLFFVFVISIFLTDKSNSNGNKYFEPAVDATSQQEMSELNRKDNEAVEDSEESSSEDESPDNSDFVENTISAEELSLQEFLDRINNIFDINDVSLELEEVDEEQDGNLITYKVESDDEEISCSVYSNKVTGKVMSMLCFVKHAVGDKDSEKQVADIVVSFVQTIFDVTDRDKIEKVIPMFENSEVIRTRAFKELGTHFEIYHHLQNDKDQSVVFINIEPAERTDSAGNNVSLQFISVSK